MECIYSGAERPTVNAGRQPIAREKEVEADMTEHLQNRSSQIPTHFSTKITALMRSLPLFVGHSTAFPRSLSDGRPSGFDFGRLWHRAPAAGVYYPAVQNVRRAAVEEGKMNPRICASARRRGESGVDSGMNYRRSSSWWKHASEVSKLPSSPLSS